MVYGDFDRVQYLLDEVTEKGVSVGYLGSGREKTESRYNAHTLILTLGPPERRRTSCTDLHP